MQMHQILIIVFLLSIGCSYRTNVQNKQEKEEIKIVNHHLEIKKNFEYKICSKESKTIDYCLEVYKPVCGWFVSSPDQCISQYCRESFANDCFACKDKRVIGYTMGNCE